MTQAAALEILKTGANVFLTGEPGSGKTHTVNAYIHYLREHGIEPAITASTGIAATHIHGSTIHSWSGIGVRNSLSPYEVDAIATTEYLSRRISKTSVLIIDEISMIDAGTLDMVDMVCREIRHSNDAFGGIQVVLVGDFFQLPPVARKGTEVKFAFMGDSWKLAKPLVCYLTEQHRQEDESLLSILAAIRTNTYDELHNQYLEARLIEPDAIESDDVLTRLFSHNADVDTINIQELSKIPGDSQRYSMQSKGRETLVASLKKGCLSPEILELKIGASVMCTKNNSLKGYVNGTLGVVVGFEEETKYPIIETREGDRITLEPADWNIEEEGKVKASITQIPLRLAWAITIHKSQGMSLDAAMMDLREVFEFGQGYVALSRVRKLSGIYLLGWNPQTCMVHPTILLEDKQFREQSNAVEDAFSNIASEELRKMHENFILACGGTVAVVKGSKAKKDTLEETRLRVLEGKTIADIAIQRKLVRATVLSHIEKLVEAKRLTREDIAYLFDASFQKSLPAIEKAFRSLDTEFLSPVYDFLKQKYSYDQLRLAKIAMKTK